MKPEGATPFPWLNAAIDLLYPPACSLCRVRLHRSEQIVCDPCRGEILPSDISRCPHCGATGAGNPPSPQRPCPKCPPPGAHYRGVLAASHYRDRAARCVHLFKYERRLEMGNLMADMMVARLAEPLAVLGERVQWIVPVPLHWRRRLMRGFNQSEILAKRLADAVGAEMQPSALRRIRHTKMQVRIPKEKRAENVAGAFEVNPRFRGALPRVLLVDDVVTSGHTVAECARVLAAAGAEQVWVASFARA